VANTIVFHGIDDGVPHSTVVWAGSWGSLPVSSCWWGQEIGQPTADVAGAFSSEFEVSIFSDSPASPLWFSGRSLSKEFVFGAQIISEVRLQWQRD